MGKIGMRKQMEQLLSHTETSFQGFCRFCSVVKLHTSPEPCSAAFMYMRIRCNAPSHYSSEADYQKKSRQRHLPRELPIYLCGQWAGEVLFTPFYTGDTHTSLRNSEDAPTEVASNLRLALSELKCPLPVASVHVDITYPWLCKHE